METDKTIEDIHLRIQQLKETARELNRMGENFPALYCNTTRILASVKMLELNVSDLAEI